jgi:hypothetical protein
MNPSTTALESTLDWAQSQLDGLVGHAMLDPNDIAEIQDCLNAAAKELKNFELTLTRARLGLESITGSRISPEQFDAVMSQLDAEDGRSQE